MTQGCADRLWVWMDVSATCNLACRDCYTKEAHEGHIMSPVHFQTILEKLRDAPISVQKLHLNWRGEPLTNKRLPELLAIRRKILPSVALEFHTNGILVRPDSLKEIFDHMLDEDLIYISIDGGCRDLHDANRGAGTWNHAIRALKIMLKEKERRGGHAPRVGVYEIFYGSRTRYDPELVTLSRSCDEWSRVSPIYADGCEPVYETASIPAAPCFWAGNTFCITSRGDVHVCLLSFRPDGRIGNLLNEKLEPVLEKAKEFRSAIAKLGRSGIPHCRGCRKSAGEADAI